MQNKFRFTLTLVTALAVLAFSTAWTVPAFADDSAPPVVENPFDQVPEETEVVVVNESGEAIPLATEEAAQALTGPDPIWCPTGVAPKPGVGGCSTSQPDLSTLVSSFIPLAKAGTIWIENVDDSGTAVLIDGTGTWAPAANFSLTLQGGWVGGITGSKTILGVSTFDTPINIWNWNGAVTVNDISMNGVPSNLGGGALTITTTKNILLSNVTAINSGGGLDGAYLDNTASTTQASVTVKNSSFHNNDWTGLDILSDGAVTLTNVNTETNNFRGVYINNNNDAIASTVTVTNSSFNTGGDDGLKIDSNGAVKLSQVTANDNTGNGVYIDNDGGTSAQPVTVTGFLTAITNSVSGLVIYSKGMVNLTNLTTSYNLGDGAYIVNTAGTPMAVNITGTNMFNDNYFSGLSIYSKGAVTLNNITAIDNGMLSDSQGVYIANNYDASKPQPITLKGYGFFLHNGNTGFEAHSCGAITLVNVTASDNGKAILNGDGYGVYLLNSGALTSKPAAITINGTNSFTDNDGTGIEVASKGTITLSNITASNNGGQGVYLTNNYIGATKGVSLQGTNYFNNNSADGLVIYSYGTIAVNNVTAYNNSGDGAYLYNFGGKGTVTTSGFGNFEYNSGDGLYVKSNGAIITNNLSAGANSNNGVDLYTIGILAPQSVTLNGTNNFNYNGNAGTESGLVINADGNIKVNNVTAGYNYGHGAILNNYTNWAAGTFATYGSVSITGFGNFSRNSTYNGLTLTTHGAVSLNTITANYNNDTGITIFADGNVTVVCSSTHGNKYGFWMYTSTPLLTLKGLITTGNTIANESLSYSTLVRTRCP